MPNDFNHVATVAMRKLEHFASNFRNSAFPESEYTKALNQWLSGYHNPLLDPYDLCSDEIAVIRLWQAIGELRQRDYPMTREDIAAHLDDLGLSYTDDDLNSAHPDSYETVRREVLRESL